MTPEYFFKSYQGAFLLSYKYRIRNARCQSTVILQDKATINGKLQIMNVILTP